MAGDLAAGFDCAHTLSDETRSLTFEEAVKFLEPDLGAQREAALCLSAADWRDIKTAIEQLCKKVGSACSKEVKEKLANASGKMAALQSSAFEKKKKHHQGGEK